MFGSIVYYLRNKEARKLKLLSIFGKNMSDEEYTKKIYRIMVGRELNLTNPQTYTEKLQWLKLNDRKPEYTMMQDKYGVRDYIAKTIGEEYLVPLLGVWNDVNDIDFDQLPNQFVLKCNHDCASVIICRDKKALDIEFAKNKLNTCLHKNYYYSSREWAYKNIKPVIIAEKYMYNKNGEPLIDYKFFCFSGKAQMVYLGTGEPHTDQQRIDYFDMEFNHLPIKRGAIPWSDQQLVKPKGFEELITLAEKLAGSIPFIRVDFYLIDDHPYFGEFAFYPSAGLSEFIPHEWEKKVGEWIQLPYESIH